MPDLERGESRSSYSQLRLLVRFFVFKIKHDISSVKHESGYLLQKCVFVMKLHFLEINKFVSIY